MDAYPNGDGWYLKSTREEREQYRRHMEEKGLRMHTKVLREDEDKPRAEQRLAMWFAAPYTHTPPWITVHPPLEPKVVVTHFESRKDIA